MQLVFDIVFVAVALAAGWFDLRTRRIPNALTLAGLLVALALRVPFGFEAILDGFWGAGFAFLLGIPFFALGAVGGGDAKLLIALGAFLGASHLLGALLVIGVVGGVLAVGDALRRGVLVRVLRNSGKLLVHLVTLGRAGSRPTLSSPGAAAIPYAVPMAIGSIIWWFFGGKLL